VEGNAKEFFVDRKRISGNDPKETKRHSTLSIVHSIGLSKEIVQL
jgi:hypothetical protein